MEKYQVKRLRPLAILVCGLTLAPVVLTPTGLLLEQALPSHNTTHTPGTKAPHSQGQSPLTTTTTTGMTAEALEGMTLDAPIRPFHQGLVTKLPA